LGIEYQIVVVGTFVKLCDGGTVLLDAEFSFRETSTPEVQWGQPGDSIRAVPADTDEAISQTIVRGKYIPEFEQFRKVLERFSIEEGTVGTAPLVALLWSSYVVGMVQPGKRALFYKLLLSFENHEFCREAVLAYEAKANFLKRMNLLRSEVNLWSSGFQIGKGEIWSFVIPENPVGSISYLEELLPSSDVLKGKVALVIGASRGLGAMITAALAMQGCTVVANYRESDSLARTLAESVKDYPGSVIPAKADAADVASVRGLKALILNQFGHLDYLVCNACPAVLPLRLEDQTIERVNFFLSESFAMVSIPMSIFLPMLYKCSGWNVAISSMALETFPKEWPHYVALKSSIESLSRVAATQYPGVNFLLVRPPKLRTDLMNTPSGVHDAQPPEVTAAKLVRRLIDGIRTAPSVEVLRS
jgi:NAD(P)-dependent dehydrogenase (short-subunit alcohol dehydrogenase family)